VPLRPGRKHLLPTATWGHVTVDDAQLPWSTTDTARLAATRVATDAQTDGPVGIQRALGWAFHADPKITIGHTYA
jgi:hypothetical protein